MFKLLIYDKSKPYTQLRVGDVDSFIILYKGQSDVEYKWNLVDLCWIKYYV